MQTFYALRTIHAISAGLEARLYGRQDARRYTAAPSVARHDLAEQGDFLHAAGDEFAAFGEDVGNGAAAFLAARGRHDAEGAMLVAALHDADKRGDGFLGVPVQQMFANGAFAPLLFRNVHDFLLPTGDDVVEVICGAMKFLRADDEVNIRQAVNQLLAAALRHAAHETEDDVGPVLADVAGDVLHLVDGLLLGIVAHAAGVEQHDVRDVFGRGEGVAFGDELRGDGFAVALVHLATVGFDIDARHFSLRAAQEITTRWRSWKAGRWSGRRPPAHPAHFRWRILA